MKSQTSNPKQDLQSKVKNLFDSIKDEDPFAQEMYKLARNKAKKCDKMQQREADYTSEDKEKFSKLKASLEE